MRVCLSIACTLALLPITAPRTTFAATVPANVLIITPPGAPVGQTTSFTLAFTNTGSVAGYGPYINLFLPAMGADGDDGLSFVSADIAGVSIAASILTCPAGSTVTSPLTHLSVACPAAPPGNHELVILPLPFVSVAPAHITPAINVAAQLSALADASLPLTIAAQAGFVHGDAPNNAEPSQGPTTSATLQPSVLTLQKTSNELEPATTPETATGPNVPRSYSLTPSMPAGLTATNLLITDTLPPDVVLIGITGATILSGPAVPGGPYAPPNNQIVFNYGTLSGAGAPIVIQYYVTHTNALSTAVLDPFTGTPASRTNTASASAHWAPIDPRDPAQVITTTATLTSINRALAVQKQVAQTSAQPYPGAHPGDLVTYTLDFQISDFFSLGNLVLTDTLSDGQTVIDGSADLVVADRDGSISGAIPSGALITTSLGAAGTQLRFDLSAALVALGATDGILRGGETVAPASSVAAAGRITYLARIADRYANNAPLQPTDPLSNTVVIAGEVLSNSNLAAPPTGLVTDDSAVAFNLGGPALGKSLYAINGSTTLPSPLRLSPDDVVTFRITYDLAAGDFNNFTLTDVLPQAVFDATTLTGFISTTVGMPAEGAAQWGAGMSTGDLSRAPAPTLITSATDNSVRFAFPDQTDPTNTATHLELLLSVRVGNAPITDGTIAVNRAESIQTNTAGGLILRTAAQSFPVAAPQLRISKGVLASDNPNAALSAPAGPVAFAPTSVTACGSRFTGTINSTGLQATPIHADLNTIDAANTVRMGIAVENIGSAINGAFDVAITDSLPAGMSYVPGTLCVQRGDGLALSFAGLDAALFTTGITLSAPLSQGLSYAAVPTNTGNNLALLSFDVTLGNTPADAPAPGQSLHNRAEVRHFAAASGGPSFVPTISGPLRDEAAVNLAPFAARKQLISTAINDATNALDQAVAGELVTYTLLITVPEGVAPNFQIIDALPTGLAFVGCNGLAASADLTATMGFAPADVCSTNINGSTITFNFGTLTNTNTSDAVAETLAITYTAVALNVASNITGTALVNTAQLNWSNNDAGPVSASAPAVRFIEPRPLASKTSDLSVGDASDTITFTLIVTNPGSNSTTLYDAVLTDAVPAGMNLNAASVAAVSGPAPILTVTAPAFTATWPSLLPGQTSVITFQVEIDPNIAAGQRITNTAFVQGSSLPGTPAAQGPNPNAVERSYTNTNATSVFIVNALQLGKNLIGTEISTTTNTRTQIGLGERITYSLLITVPEGATPNVRITDTLDSGLTFVDFIGIAATPNLQFAQPLSSYLTPTVSNIGPEVNRRAVWSFGTLTNTSINSALAATLQLTYTARLLNTPTNTQPQTRTNSAVLGWANTELPAAGAPAVQIIEPALQVAKSAQAARNPIGAGDRLTYTLRLTNTGTAAALEVNLTDTLPLSVSFLATQHITVVQGISTGLVITDANAIGATTLAWQLSSLAAGSVVEVLFVAQAANNLGPNLVLTNIAAATGSNLIGASPYKRIYTTTPALAMLNSANAVVGFSKATSQISLAPGALITYSLRLTNTSIVAAQNLVMTDRVPANTTLISAAPAGLVTAANGLVTWTLSNLAANGNAALTLTVRTNTPLPNGMPITNTAYLTTSAAQAGAILTPSATITSVITSDHALALFKGVQPRSAAPGDFVTYTLAYTVSGNAPATHLTLSDTLPISLSLLSSNRAPDLQQGQMLTWSLGTLSPTLSAPAVGFITFTAQISTTPVVSGSQWLNTAGLRDDELGPIVAAAPVTITAVNPSLQLVKVAHRPNVRAGQQISFTLFATNTGLIGLLQVPLTDAFDSAYLQFVAASPAPSTSSANQLVWQNVGPLPPTAGARVVVTFTAVQPTLALGPTPGTNNLVTSVITTANTSPLVVAAQAPLTILPPTSHTLQLSKSATPATAIAGGLLTYTLGFSVAGDEPAPNVVLIDTLPAGVSLIDCAGCTVIGQQLRWSLGNLNPPLNEARTVVVRVAQNMPDGATLVNSARITDTATGDAAATIATTVAFGADVAIAKSAQTNNDSAVVRSGSLVTYTLTVTNNGPSDIAGPVPMRIPGDISTTIGPAALYPVVIAVNEADQPIITDITVTVSGLSHNYAADLDLLLVGPNGRAVMLMSDAGGIRNIADVTLRFHDGAPLPPDSDRVTSGVYAPSDYVGNDGVETLPASSGAPAPQRPYGTALDVFKGLSANGEWRLYVADDQTNDAGQLARGWMLTLATSRGNRSYTSQAALRVEDTLPAGSVVVDGTPGFGGPNPVMWLDGLAAGATRIYTLTTQLNFAGQTQVQNTAQVSHPLPELVPGNNTSHVDLTVINTGISVITNTTWPTLTPGGTTYITIPLANGTDVTGTGLVITVALPWWLDMIFIPPTWVEVAPGVWSIPVESLVPGSTGAIVLPINVPVVLPPGVAAAEIVITIGGPGITPTPIVISAPVDTQPKLIFDKSASPPSGSSLHIGDHITYTLVVTNTGPFTLTQLTLADAVPSSTAYVQGSAAPPATTNDNTLKWPIALLPPQTTVTFTFAVTLYRTSATTYPISNTATLQGTGLVVAASNAVQHLYLPDAVQLGPVTIEPETEPGSESGSESGTEPMTAGLRIRWTSLVEIDTFGFALYRSETDQRKDAVLATPQLRPAQGAGVEYTFVDPAARPGQAHFYWLQEVEVTGRVTEYGPFEWQPNAARTPAAAPEARLYLPMVLR